MQQNQVTLHKTQDCRPLFARETFFGGGGEDFLSSLYLWKRFDIFNSHFESDFRVLGISGFEMRLDVFSAHMLKYNLGVLGMPAFHSHTLFNL
jgi:hypothetical protein